MSKRDKLEIEFVKIECKIKNIVGKIDKIRDELTNISQEMERIGKHILSNPSHFFPSHQKSRKSLLNPSQTIATAA